MMSSQTSHDSLQHGVRPQCGQNYANSVESVLRDQHCPVHAVNRPSLSRQVIKEALWCSYPYLHLQSQSLKDVALQSVSV